MQDQVENKELVLEEVPAVSEQPVPPVPEQPVTPVEDPAKGVVGFGAFFGLKLLFAIPVIGWIACIIMSFAPKRKSLKNYARAFLAWLLIGFVITTTIFVAIGNFVAKEINGLIGTEFGGIGEMIGIISDVNRGDYSSLIKQMGGMLGEEYRDIFDELGSGEYNDLIDMLKDGEYEEALDRFEKGEYQGLVDKLDKDTYDALLEELKQAKDGNPSEMLQELQNFDPSDLSSLFEQAMGSIG